MTATAELTTPIRGVSAERATTIAWVVLSLITVGSWFLSPGHSGGTATASVPITVAVVVLGVIKGRLIIRHFMEVGTAPRWLKLATDSWLIALWAAILVIYVY